MMPQKIVLVQRALIREGSRILIVQRAKNDRWAPGLWELPGGKVEPESDLRTNLAREIGEEIALEVIIRSIFWHYDKKGRGKLRGYRYIVLLFEAWLKTPKIKPRLSREHMGFRWIDPQALPRSLRYSPGTKAAIKRFLEQY